MTSRTPAPHLRRLALVGAVVACLPYLLLKVAWLAGSTVGARPGRGEELHAPGLVVANAVTLVLIGLALATAVGLTRPWGRRLPATAFLVMAVGSTGLLVPIAAGLPIGMAVQVALGEGTGVGGGADLQDWVRPMVYGGFSLLAVSLTVLLALHAADRWPALVATAPRLPGRLVTALGVGGTGAAGLAMVGWGVVGGGDLSSDPTPLQRTAEVVTGLIVLGGPAAPLACRLRAGGGTRRPLLVWTVCLVGCATALMEALRILLLGPSGSLSVGVVVVSVLGAAAGVAFGLGVLQHALGSGPDLRRTGPRASVAA